MATPRLSLHVVTSATATGRKAMALVLLSAALIALGTCTRKDAAEIDTAAGEIAVTPDPIDEGRWIFRFETSGNEHIRTDTTAS
ncbi:MAG TPA: hypothetical protein VIK50_13275 [Gemmatimonadaceae bacterium]